MKGRKSARGENQAVNNMTGSANIFSIVVHTFEAASSFRVKLAGLVLAGRIQMCSLDSVGSPESLGKDFGAAGACNLQLAQLSKAREAFFSTPQRGLYLAG